MTYIKLYQLVIETNLGWLVLEKAQKVIISLIYYKNWRANVKEVGRVLRFSSLGRDYLVDPELFSQEPGVNHLFF